MCDWSSDVCSSDLLLLDTSAAIPLVLTSHDAHNLVSDAIGTRSVSLAGHALHETYSVLTRLPGDARHAPNDATRLLRERFEPAATPTVSPPPPVPGLPATRTTHGGGIGWSVGVELGGSGC